MSNLKLSEHEMSYKINLGKVEKTNIKHNEQQVELFIQKKDTAPDVAIGRGLIRHAANSIKNSTR